GQDQLHHSKQGHGGEKDRLHLALALGQDHEGQHGDKSQYQQWQIHLPVSIARQVQHRVKQSWQYDEVGHEDEVQYQNAPVQSQQIAIPEYSPQQTSVGGSYDIGGRVGQHPDQ